MTKYLLIAFTLALISPGCEEETASGWQKVVVQDQFDPAIQKIEYEVIGSKYSKALKEAKIKYDTLNDLISFDLKPMFTITLNGRSFDDSVYIKTPDNTEFAFGCYDGIIFNIDSESHDIERLIELMQHKELSVSQGKYSFSINTSGFPIK